MKSRFRFLLVGAALMMPVAATLAADVALPGDRGPMGRPMPPGAPQPAGPPPKRQPDVVAVGPSIEVALKAARALVYEGVAQPNGYTEPLLHAARRDLKGD